MPQTIRKLLQGHKYDSISFPHIILGQFERVGSTFYLDLKEKNSVVHNEPYKQLIPKSWPISRSYNGRLITIEDFLNSETNILNKIWLLNFSLSRYGGSQEVIKETCLYFSLKNFLELFPFKHIEILSRNPIGIVSSFKRSDLFKIWDYNTLIKQLNSQINSASVINPNFYRPFVEPKTNWTQQIAWLIALNSMIIAKECIKENVIITYYDDILKIRDPNILTNKRQKSSVFGTNTFKNYDNYEKVLTNTEIKDLHYQLSIANDYILRTFKLEDNEIYKRIFTNYLDKPLLKKSNYRFLSARSKKGSATHGINLRKLNVSNQNSDIFKHAYKDNKGINWRRALITNIEYAYFMQNLLDSGLGKDLHYLLLRNDMPTTRGGRIVLKDGQYKIAKGYEYHPVYWLTWLGAAAYARHNGYRLPTSEEWKDAFNNISEKDKLNGNHSYKFDDVVEEDYKTSSIQSNYFGNVKVWCSDWSDKNCQSKNIAGISWKHYLTSNYKVISSKPFLTNSRTIGSRLIIANHVKAIDIKSIVDLLNNVNNYIDSTMPNRSSELTKINQKISKLF